MIRSERGLFICSEDAIVCRNLADLKLIIANMGANVVLGMPEEQLKSGLRGPAKARILQSILKNITGVVGLTDEEIKDKHYQNGWKNVRVFGPVMGNTQRIIDSGQPVSFPEFPITNNPVYLEAIKTAKKLVDTSNCWLDPAACVFLKKNKIICEGVSTRQHSENCRMIPINFKDLELNPGERLLFCDSQHAERVGVSYAAREGISLKGTTAVMTKFPCRPCMQSLITAGVKKIVYEVGSYGYRDAELLISNGIEINRVIESPK